MRLVFLFIIAFATVTEGHDPQAVLVDEFGTLCSDDLRSRLDLFFATVSEKPASVGYIVGHAEQSMPGRFHKYFRMFQNHVRFRRFDPDRVKYFRGPNTDSMKFQFWLVPWGAQPKEIPLEFPREIFENAVMFDASEISSIKKGVVDFGGDWGNEPCDFGLDLNQFAITLGGNPNLTGYLIASSHNRRDRANAKMALSLTKADLTKSHRIHPSRIKTVFVGNRNARIMQLWLVPNGSPAPDFRANSVP